MKSKLKLKKKNISRRKKSIKSKLTIGKYPRLVVFRSNIHLYAQLIDDNQSKTMFSISTNDEKWATTAKFYSEVDYLRNKYSEKNDNERIKLLESYNQYVMDIEKKFENA